MHIEVSVIVVAFNSACCIEECLNSILGQQGVSFEIIVVDNASTDSTLTAVRKLGERVRLLPNRENVGFGRGCNQGFAASRGRFVFLLNPDARLEQPDGLARLCAAMAGSAQWGLAGTRVTEADGTVECRPAATYPDQDRVRCDFSHLPGAIAWVFGASMFIRREVFEAVGGFDPGFFLTSEETDLCLRIRQHGWEIGFVPGVMVRHIGLASERGLDPYQTWSRRIPGIYRFWLKHYPKGDARRLLWKDCVRAGFRRGWYGLLARFRGQASAAWLKHREYAAINDTARHFLRATPPSPFCPTTTADRPVSGTELTP